MEDGEKAFKTVWNDMAIKQKYTRKQMGDACEMLVAAELTLAGIPALKVPDNWPHYDVIAQPADGESQRISVKSRTFKTGPACVGYAEKNSFDWLAIVLLPSAEDAQRRIFIIPRSLSVCDKGERKFDPETRLVIILVDSLVDKGRF